MTASRAKLLNPKDFVTKYKIDHDLSPSERLADFLYQASISLPYRFFDKRLCAKVAFGLTKTPPETADYVKTKLPGIRYSAEKKLRDRYKKEIFTDRVEGFRATVDDADLVKTKHRAKRKRVDSAVKSLNQTDNLVDPSKLKGSLKNELQRSRRALTSITQSLGNLPQLPPGDADQ